MTSLFSLATLGSLVSLAGLEIVLGIDNIIFLSILVAKLPVSQQPLARRLGLVLALGMRICLLLTLAALASLTAPWFHVFGHGVSGRDLVLLVGGAFLVFKSTWEIFSGLEGDDEEAETVTASEVQRVRRRELLLTLVQIMLMDIIFSLDSVITAVGIAQSRIVMIAAMVLAMFVMMGFAKAIGDFVNRHPSMKVLALSFLVMIGTLLVAEGGGQHINHGYIYAAMAFGFAVECLNLWLRRRATDVAELHGRARHVRHIHPDLASLETAERASLVEIISEQSRRILELEGALARNDVAPPTQQSGRSENAPIDLRPRTFPRGGRVERGAVAA